MSLSKDKKKKKENKRCESVVLIIRISTVDFCRNQLQEVRTAFGSSGWDKNLILCFFESFLPDVMKVYSQAYCQCILPQLQCYKMSPYIHIHVDILQKHLYINRCFLPQGFIFPIPFCWNACSKSATDQRNATHCNEWRTNWKSKVY